MSGLCSFRWRLMLGGAIEGNPKRRCISLRGKRLNSAHWKLIVNQRLPIEPFMAIIATKVFNMRSVNVAELKNQLSKYLTFAKNGEEIVIRDRSLPVAKIIPFSTGDANEQELLLVAAGKLRMPKESLDLEKLLAVPSKRTTRRAVTRTLVEEREHSR